MLQNSSLLTLIEKALRIAIQQDRLFLAYLLGMARKEILDPSDAEKGSVLALPEPAKTGGKAH
jgi:hypothetical protein